MPTPLDVALQAVVSRTWRRHALRAVAAGAIAGAAALLVSRALGLPAAITIGACITALAAVAAAVLTGIRRERTPAAAARAFERTEPSLRNLVVTAQEIQTRPDGWAPYMRTRVLADAGRRAAAIEPRSIVPLGRDAAVAIVATVLLAIAAIMPVPARSLERAVAGSPERGGVSAGEASFAIEIVPPDYTGRPLVRLLDPVSLEALAGSRAVIAIRGGVEGEIRLNGALVPVSREGVARAVLTRSGYLAIDAGSVHRLLPLSVVPDRAPEVRITAPAKDLRVATSAVTIPIAAEAADDLALRSFELRYTVVSGTGEQFSFTEGTLPAKLARGSDRTWRLEGTLSPAGMKLEAGDALIYRAVAADRRPGDAGLASSDTFFVEIAGPGDVALAGVEMPPDKERYALSEAMIVLKIERLRAREQGMPRPALEEAAATIAAEQRAVRANFVFLLGGEIEDETVEAETSSEIAEGRFANQARQEIVKATILMARVEHALAAVSTKDALPLAREAVKALQRAFGHSRYLLRALPSRARIDPARRGSGDLTSASDWQRALAPAASDPQTEAARGVLVDLIAAARDIDDPSARAGAAGRLSRLAERILSLGAGAADLPPVAREVLAARDALAAGQSTIAREAIQRAAAPLVVRTQRGRIEGRAVPRDWARLAGAAAIAAGRRSSTAAQPERRRQGGGSR